MVIGGNFHGTGLRPNIFLGSGQNMNEYGFFVGHVLSNLNLKLVAAHAPHVLLLELNNDSKNAGFWVKLMV
jgi:hypothetical protein